MAKGERDREREKIQMNESTKTSASAKAYDKITKIRSARWVTSQSVPFEPES